MLFGLGKESEDIILRDETVVFPFVEKVAYGGNRWTSFGCHFSSNAPAAVGLNIDKRRLGKNVVS